MILTEEQQQILDMTRAFAESELKPHAAEWEAAGYVPDEVVRKMGELGLMGMLVPEEWGGAGVDYGTYALVVEELAAGDASVSTLMSVHTSVVCLPILNFGTEAQKQRFLRPLSTGGMVGAFCLTEPGAGSDAAAIKCRAVGDGDSYVLNGSKQFISNGKRCGVALVIAVTPPAAGKEGINAFLTASQKEEFKNKVPVEMKEGCATFHHPLMVHGSYKNESSKPRRAFVLNVFADATTSASNEALLQRVPVVEKGKKMEGRFFPLLFDPQMF